MHCVGKMSSGSSEEDVGLRVRDYYVEVLLPGREREAAGDFSSCI